MFDQYDFALLIFGIIAVGWAMFATYTGERGPILEESPSGIKHLSSFGDKLQFSI